MKLSILLATLLLAIAPTSKAESRCSELLSYQAPKLRSTKMLDFCTDFNDKVLLVVNTASNCGYTPQFKGLEALYQKYKDQGLVIVGFPSNDFDQEFDDAKQTAEVCYINYGVSFPMLATSSVKGPAANPFFKGLIQATGKAPQWNFYKYLIARDGTTVIAFESHITPEQLDAKVQALLTQRSH